MILQNIWICFGKPRLPQSIAFGIFGNQKGEFGFKFKEGQFFFHLTTPFLSHMADSTGRQAGYTTTAADGAFRLRPRQGMRAASVEVSMMGYRPQRHTAARLPREIRLEAEAVKLATL